MANRQLLAQIGVFALLGLNIGAYYVFWPARDAAKTEAKAPKEEKGSAQILPEKKEVPAKPVALPPKDVPRDVVQDAVPLHIPNAPTAVEDPASSDPVRKLLEHIKKDAAPQPVLDPKPPTLPIEEKKPNPLVPLKADLLKIEARNDKDVAVAPATTPKMAPSPWLLSMEMLGHQTKLTAKLRLADLELRILCDRLEMKADTILALGKVTFTGAGWKGGCQRMALPLHEVKLVFEDKVHLIADANSSSVLRADRVVWEPVAPVPMTIETEPLTSPDTFRPKAKVESFPNGLGQPK